MKTNPDQLKLFHDLLMENSPKDYTTWLIPVAKSGKAVDGRVIFGNAPIKSCCGVGWKTIPMSNGTRKTICDKCGKTKGSWKQAWACLTLKQAVGYMKCGYNIGIAARVYDPLTIVDIDNYKYANLLKATLISKSRKRCGLHGFYWNANKKKIPNIPTENAGEVRSWDQYVICPGSFVPTTEKEIEAEFKSGCITAKQKEEILNDPKLGCYTVHQKQTPSSLKYSELPKIFIEAAEIQKPVIDNKPGLKDTTVFSSGKHSALFDLRISDIVSVNGGARVAHPLHASDTSANFSMDNSHSNLAHCWRHNVSLNALQFLAVKSGYTDCCEAGTGHHGTNPSRVTGNDGAIFYAWLQAKKDNLIPRDDPIPVRAMKFIAEEHKLISPGCSEDRLPNFVYKKVLKIVEVEY